jgi:hypothetical protein
MVVYSLTGYEKTKSRLPRVYGGQVIHREVTNEAVNGISFLCNSINRL